MFAVSVLCRSIFSASKTASRSASFADDVAARAAAEDIARELSKNRIDGEQWRIVVTNEAGEQIAVVPTLWVQK